MKITKRKTNLLISIPLTDMRSNPYDPEYLETMDSLMGLIEDDKFGFCYRINMSYKGKDDQWTDFILRCDMDMERESFIGLCDRLGIQVVTC